MAQPTAPELVGDWVTEPVTSLTDLQPSVAVLVFGAPTDPATTALVDEVASIVAHNRGDVAGVVSSSPRLQFETDPAVTADWVAEMAHPNVAVIHDAVLANWHRYHPRGWPTAYVLDRQTRIVGAVEGPDCEALRHLVTHAQFDRRRFGRRQPVPPSSDLTERQYGLVGPTQALPDSGLHLPSSVAVAPDGTVVVSNTGGDEIWWLRLADTGELGSPAVAEVISRRDGIDRPGAVAVRPGKPSTVVVAEPSLGRVLEFGPNATKELVGGLERPTALATSADGRVYVADGAAGLILAVDESSGGEPEVVVVAGERHPLAGPSGLAWTGVDSTLTRRERPRLVVAEGNASRISLVRRGAHRPASGSAERPGLLDGRAPSASWHRPGGLCQFGDGIAAVDTGSSKIRILQNGRVTTLPVSGLRHPRDIAAIDDRRLLVADTGNHRLVLVEPAVNRVETVAISFPVAKPTIPRPQRGRSRRDAVART